MRARFVRARCVFDIVKLVLMFGSECDKMLLQYLITQEIKMFNRLQLGMIEKALVASEKSAQRLAVREGQPENVAAEYRKFAGEVAVLIKGVQAEIVKLDSVVKKS